MANTMTARKDRRSWWQRFWRVAAQPAQPVSVGMDGLPAGVGVLPVGAPAVLLAADEASSQVWGPLVLQSLLAAGPVLVLASSAQQADALWQHAPLRQAYAAGQLQVMLFPAKQQALLRQENLGAWASEVRRAGLAAGASLCILDARAMFLGAAQAQLRSLGGQLRRFAKRHAWPIVLMLPLAPPASAGGAALQASLAEAEQLASAARSASLGLGHVATLEHTGDHPVLALHSWDGPQGAMFHMRYDLQLQAGRLCYAGSYSHGEVPVLVQAPDLEVVYTTTACVPPPIEVPAHWVVLPDWAALEHATQQAKGATVLLDVGDPQAFDALCALVYRLRSRLAPSVKIIVRETSGKLRAHSEQALLHLGVTAVAYRELGFARLLRMIASARTLVHTQPVQGTMEQVLGAFAPAHVRGYQAPAAFEQAARQMLQRSRAVGLVHSLVHLQLLPRIAHVDALQACRVLRNGDLVTADAQGLQLFLFACTPSDVPYALNNMFALPLEQLFAAQTVDSSEVGIAHALQQLRTQAARLPDYTVALQAAAAAVVEPAVEPAAAPVVAAAPAAMTLLPPMAPQPPQTERAAQPWRAHPIGRRSTKILESSV